MQTFLLDTCHVECSVSGSSSKSLKHSSYCKQPIFLGLLVEMASCSPTLRSLSSGRDVAGRWLSSQDCILQPFLHPDVAMWLVLANGIRDLCHPPGGIWKTICTFPALLLPSEWEGFHSFRDWWSHRMQGAWISELLTARSPIAADDDNLQWTGCEKTSRWHFGAYLFQHLSSVTLVDT